MYQFFYVGLTNFQEMQACSQQIPLLFHYLGIFVSLPLHFLIFYKAKFGLAVTFHKPTFLQKLTGWLGLLLLAFQFYDRIRLKMLISNLFPCHFALLTQSLLLLSHRSHYKFFLGLRSMCFGVFLALIFPDLGGLDDNGIKIYYIEHLMILPFGVLLLQRRYGSPPLFDLFQHIIGFSYFGIYQRFLEVVSLLTWVNLNSTLCHQIHDPFYPIVGNSYILWAEVYLSVGSWLIKIMIGLISRTLRIGPAKIKLKQ